MVQNSAAWLPSAGAALKVGPSELPQPGEGELVVENHAIAVQPADWKLQKGLLPITLKYPTILGSKHAFIPHLQSRSVCGIKCRLRDVGAGVTRFKKGDRVLTCTAMILRNGDTRYSGYQKYVLSTQAMTCHVYRRHAVCVCVNRCINSRKCHVRPHLHLHLDKPSKNPSPKPETVLIWGGASTLGSYSIQIAAQAGYKVVTTASAKHAEYLHTLGAQEVIDYTQPSTSLLAALHQHGPYHTIFSAMDNPSSQAVMGEYLASQGGGEFLTAKGAFGVKLLEGVEGRFVQFLDDFLKEELEEFTRWFY
ncbi:hypothetical protein K440DRAFT_557695 [Wilcoxina mikolae CBS 423.85]|nr:hypothetical protein K440DRAFT_557695 [Wilcoxina mikolae CBS 423.85]